MKNENTTTLTEDQLDEYHKDFLNYEAKTTTEAYKEHLGTYISSVYDKNGKVAHYVDMGKNRVVLVNDEVLTKYQVTGMVKKEGV